jgi:hypothetical protein
LAIESAAAHAQQIDGSRAAARRRVEGARRMVEMAERAAKFIGCAGPRRRTSSAWIAGQRLPAPPLWAAGLTMTAIFGRSFMLVPYCQKLAGDGGTLVSCHARNVSWTSSKSCAAIATR